MEGKTKRPIYLPVFSYRYPVTAIASVLHRISGIILFILIPLFLWLLQHSLMSLAGFQQLQTFFANPIIIVLKWLILAALLYHLIAGIRHLLMDAGVGDSLKGGRTGAYAVIIVTLILLIVGILI